MEATVLIVSFFALVIIGVPICFSLGASGIIYLLLQNPGLLITLPQRVWAGSNSFVLIALPLFILAGELMNIGGITKRIVDFSLYLVRPFRGGLGEVNVVASMIFGGISGSSVADTSAIGTVLILAGQFVWLGWCDTFWYLATFPLIGGLMTAVAYWYDHSANLARRVELSDERD